MNKLLVGDIGGTNSRFSLFSNKNNTLVLESELWEKTNSFQSFEELLHRIKERDPRYDVNKVSTVTVAVPGAVTSDNVILLPYVRWAIDRGLLHERYPDANIFIINDFVAQAYGCLTQATADALHILVGAGGQGQANQDIAIVGAGTGTGHGTLKRAEDGRYLSIPSEAGHIPFPFLAEDREEASFRNFLLTEKKIISPVCNDVVSGPGISRIHHFFTGKELPASQVVQELDAESETVKYFARFYGRACRNYALSTLASGGKLFISGGVTIKNPFLVDNESFRNEFLQSETTAKDLLQQIDVFLIKDERIGLFGAAQYQWLVNLN
ncbi:MAG: glucokinase [Candidatus Electrothrix sp. AW5]|nr:glucokinase [Candidatus Electrothrix gigas]